MVSRNKHRWMIRMNELIKMWRWCKGYMVIFHAPVVEKNNMGWYNYVICMDNNADPNEETIDIPLAQV